MCAASDLIEQLRAGMQERMRCCSQGTLAKLDWTRQAKSYVDTGIVCRLSKCRALPTGRRHYINLVSIFGLRHTVFILSISPFSPTSSIKYEPFEFLLCWSKSNAPHMSSSSTATRKL